MDVRARLVDFMTRHQHKGDPANQRVEVAASHVWAHLEYVTRAAEEARAASDAYLDAYRRVREHKERLGPGEHPIEGQHLLDWQEHHRAHFLLEYRVDTLYVWARALMDDAAALLNAAIPKATKPQQTGTRHTEAMKRLPAIAAEVGLTGWEPVVERGTAFAALRDFRNDHAVHRSSKKPRDLRGITVHPVAGARVQASGILYPREGEEPPMATSEDPDDLLAQLELYVDAIVDMLEPLAPPRSPALPSPEQITEILKSER
jgi:hypothetical protein